MGFPVNNIFPNIDNSISADAKLTEEEISQISLGAIVTFLAHRLTNYANIGPVDDFGAANRLSPYLKVVGRPAPPEFEGFMIACRDPDVIKAHTNENSECLVIPHYPLGLKDLYSKAGLTIKNSSFLFHNPETINLEMLNIIGQKVIDGTLPFDILILEEAFPEIEEDLNHLAALIEPNSKYAQYCQIKEIFRQAKEASKMNETPDGENFRMILESLRIKTLNNFLAGTSKYNAKGSKLIANNALILAQKIGQKNVTQNDIKYFILATKDYKEHTWLYILVNILAGISLGSILGLLVGGISSAVFAIPAGIFIGLALGTAIGGAASLACTMLNHPITEMAKTLPAAEPCNSTAISLTTSGF